MTISKDLYLAILALDAYNRGYGAGIADGGTDDTDGLGGVGSRIGSTTVIRQSDNETGTPGVAAGFYAVAYTMGDGSDVPQELRGKTIISYRGTDNPSLFASDAPGGADITLGWVAGAGNPTDQTTMAIDALNGGAGPAARFECASCL